MIKPVASDVHDSREGNCCFTVGGWHARHSGQSQLSFKEEKKGGAGNVQPIELPIVCEFEDKFVNHTIDANRATDELEISVCGIVEDEVVPIKSRQAAPPYATSQLFKTVSEFLAYLKRSDLQSEYGSRMALVPWCS